MKRELLQNTKVQPYTSGAVIDRFGFLSAILGAVIGTNGTLTVTVTHSDDGTTFVAVPDKLVFPETTSTSGVLNIDTLTVGDIINIDVDLVGLKPYVKFTVSGAAAASTTLAIVIGDSDEQPV
ncbi:hypothetical protein AGMMS49975_22540 [Clostridia bacterium]|nr:hypothetical protein AGMMS49975_22540 [Clostridia bacterium]